MRTVTPPWYGMTIGFCSVSLVNSVDVKSFVQMEW